MLLRFLVSRLLAWLCARQNATPRPLLIDLPASTRIRLLFTDPYWPDVVVAAPSAAHVLDSLGLGPCLQMPRTTPEQVSCHMHRAQHALNLHQLNLVRTAYPQDPGLHDRMRHDIARAFLRQASILDAAPYMPMRPTSWITWPWTAART